MPVDGRIKALNESKFEKFILIDDAHLFLAPPPLPHRLEYWPSIAEVITALKNSDEEPYVLILDDVIISVPKHTHQQVAEYCQQQRTTTLANKRGEALRAIRKGFKMLMEN